jgi:hypothetical protein
VPSERSRESYDHSVEGQLSTLISGGRRRGISLRGFRDGALGGGRAHDIERVDDEWIAFRFAERGGVADVKVQMRSVRISGVA